MWDTPRNELTPEIKNTPSRKITKIVSGDTPETLEKIAHVYAPAVKAGVYKAESIKVAEAAKVIEKHPA